MRLPSSLLPLLTITAGWLAAIAPTLHAQDEAGRLFGSQERNEEALIGILYDFKMNQKREPTGTTPNNYVNILDEFLDSGLDESALNRYFRATKAVYTTQIFIPLTGADAFPKAFGVEKIVKPRMVAVHYKGQVLPPRAGTYRFVGFADDIIIVAVNGKTVCLGGRMEMKQWKSSEGPGMQASNGRMIIGDWIDLKMDKPIDLDILIGERPGGQFAAFLCYQEKGVNYEMQGSDPILPVFQLANAPIPKGGDKNAPPYAPPGALWKAVP